jgi:flagellin-like hook-associated protein FlgL
MLGGINSVTGQLASIYNSNNSLLAETLSRIASGKKINRPSDDFTGYARSQNIEQDIGAYARVKENLTEAIAVADIASSAGNSIYQDITRMKELTELYQANGVSDDDKAAYAAEFEALKTSVADTIGQTYYNGSQLVASGSSISVALDPEGNGNFVIDFDAGDIPDASGLYISSGSTALQDELDTATLYVVKAESYSDHATRQMDMTDTIIQSKKSVVSLITDIDDAEELSNSINLQIRQQATVAMMAQANAAQAGIISLYR